MAQVSPSTPTRARPTGHSPPSSTALPTTRPTHARTASRPDTPTLPSKYRVPAVPSRIHRRLYLNPLEDGLSISPASAGGSTSKSAGNDIGSGLSEATDSQGDHQYTKPGHSWSDDSILIQYGPKGLISRQTHRPTGFPPMADHKEPEHELEIGGIVGLVRLWETAYLLIFLRPPPETISASTSAAGPSSAPPPPNPAPTQSHPSTIHLFPKPLRPHFPPGLPLPPNERDSIDDGGSQTGVNPLIRSLRAIVEREGLMSPKRSGSSDRVAELDPSGSRTPRTGPESAAQPIDPIASNGRTQDEADHANGEDVQRTVYELKQVYAIPLTREGAEGVIRVIKANVAKGHLDKLSWSDSGLARPDSMMEELKAKQPVRKPGPDPAAPSSSTSDPITKITSADSTTSSSSSIAPEPTPLQAFTRALDPKRWVLPKIGGLGGGKQKEVRAVGTEEDPEEPQMMDKEDAERQVGDGNDAAELEATGVFDDTAKAAETAGIGKGLLSSNPDSGDLGESRLLGEVEEAKRASMDDADENNQVASGEADAEPDAETVMAAAAGTQTAEEKANQSKRSSFLGIGTGKVWNPFVRLPSKSTVPTVSSTFSDKAKGEASTRTSLEDEHPDTSENDLLDQSQKHQEEKASVKTPAQRKDFETKIVREICKLFSGNGGMFYSFETDLSHNLQEKRKKLESRTQSKGLLGQLLEKDRHVSRPSLHLDSCPTTPAASAESGPAASVGHKAAPGISTESTQSDQAGLDPSSEASGYTWVEPDIHLPLWRRVDPRFMWNGWLVREFQELGLHSYIIPIIQGWVQASRFYIPPMPTDPLLAAAATGKPYRTSLDILIAPPSILVDMVLISRRSKERAGLRYLRRGIDEDGNVANFVETEMMIRVKVEGKWSIFSFVQIRGSIPLVWTQNSTLADLKPAPVLERPVDQTLGITRLHFEDIKRRYGSTTIVNLAELTGKEGPLSHGYRDAVAQLQDDSLQDYVDFDFHNECRGLRYENISKLVDNLKSEFGRQGYYWTCQNEVMRQQAGVFRVNCIDCLDRTGVTQSVLARHVLANQLQQVGILPDANSDIERVYNDAWANNGDQISLEYSGSSALKGRFTRTGKRDIQGMLNDGMNSLTRMYTANFSDHFSQAAISFATGERSISVFSEFLNSMQSSDSTAIIRLSRLRHAAIEVCSARCIADEGERRLNGWTMYAPEAANVKTSPKMEEKVILLTKAALYIVSFDYDLEKVVSSTQIPLRNITQIKKGAYILTPLQEAGRDAEENAGFQVFFKPPQSGTRFTSYTMLNAAPGSPVPSEMTISGGRNRSSSTASQRNNAESQHLERIGSDGEFFAFKALPREFIAPPGQQDDEDEENQAGPVPSCRDQVDTIVRRIREECVRSAGSVGGYVGGRAREVDFVVDEDVVR